MPESFSTNQLCPVCGKPMVIIESFEWQKLESACPSVNEVGKCLSLCKRAFPMCNIYNFQIEQHEVLSNANEV